MGSSVDIAAVARQLGEIAARAADYERRFSAELAAVHPNYRASARNLVHYLALRQEDIRELQEQLAVLGLSSLGRSERNVLGSIRAVRAALCTIASGEPGEDRFDMEPLELRNRMATRHKAAILGDEPVGRDVSIMVTLPEAAGEDVTLVADMIAAGMNLARINCSRGDEASWAAMIANTREASRAAGVASRILMDLPGPKIRTGELAPGPRVVHIRPRRDPLGQTIAPRRIRFIPDDTVWRGTKSAVIPLSRTCVDRARVGDELRFRDIRGAKRRLQVIARDEKGIVAEAHAGAYIATGTTMRLCRAAGSADVDGKVGELPAIEQPLLLRPGDRLVLDRDPVPGAPAVEDGNGNVLEPAHIACRQPDVFDDIAAGDRVSFDDGRIAGAVLSSTGDKLLVEITKAKPTGSRLRGDRGINFPDSDIRLPGLSSVDRNRLEFIVRHADSVGLSFVRTPADIVDLQEALGGRPLGLVVKIETQRAFGNLPQLLLTAMRQYPVAVMIARGDLAVEAGWARLAELQEEILWFCEAAQIPVIWATQVLERTAKRGTPSRAEISDAALSQRADCVMLNKGPHIIAAIGMLDNILRRMQGHQYKKTPRFRKLSLSIE